MTAKKHTKKGKRPPNASPAIEIKMGNGLLMVKRGGNLIHVPMNRSDDLILSIENALTNASSGCPLDPIFHLKEVSVAGKKIVIRHFDNLSNDMITLELSEVDQFIKDVRNAIKQSIKKEFRSIAFYVAAYIDLLGQRSRLRKLNTLPKPEEEYGEHKSIWAETFGAVIKLRDRFEELYGQYWTKTKTAKLHIPRRKMGIHSLADGLVIYIPLYQSKDISTGINLVTIFEGIQSMLRLCASVMYLQLMDKKPVRGGIDLGISLEMHKTGIYGRAPFEAYELESRKAGYPRIVVGENIVNLLDSSLRDCEIINDDYARTAKGLIELCSKMIIKDHDGCLILDWMKVVDLSKSPMVIGMQRISDFVASELDRFKSAGDDKHTFRYSLLMDYITQGHV